MWTEINLNHIKYAGHTTYNFIDNCYQECLTFFSFRDDTCFAPLVAYYLPNSEDLSEWLTYNGKRKGILKLKPIYRLLRWVRVNLQKAGS